MAKSGKDTLYANTLPEVQSFRFDDQVADVFSDMIERSVPGYRMMLEMIGVISRHYAKPKTYCYDLGCSLGASTLAILNNVPAGVRRVIGIDNSAAMIDRGTPLLGQHALKVPWELRCQDILDLDFEPCSLVAMNFTLQFIPKEQRVLLLQRIANAMVPAGAFVLSEKIHAETAETDQLLIDLHHDFKRARGYSELEIAQKRNALENVLIPETISQHRKRLLDAGFSRVEVWFQCFNFVSMLAIK